MPCRLTVLRYLRAPRPSSSSPRTASSPGTAVARPPARVLQHEPYLPGTNAGFFTSTPMLTGQAGREIPRRMGIYNLTLRERYEQFCRRGLSRYEAEIKRVEERGLEWWETPRSATLFSAAVREEEPSTSSVLPTADKRSPAASTPLPRGRVRRESTRPTGFFVRPAHTSSFLRQPAFPSNSFRFPPSSSASFSSVADRRAAELRGKIPADKEIDLQRIMDDLRDLELLDLLRDVRPKAAVGYKDATRALYPLYHKLDQGTLKRVTFADLEGALLPDFTLPWTSIAERLLEGRVSRLEGLTAKQKAALLFLQIYSIGPTRAIKYADAGCRTLEDLERRADSEKLKLTKAQKIGLRHREDIQRLIPRDEVEKLKKVLEKALAAVDPRFECEVLGSYRRGVDFSSDIDLAVRHPDFQDKDDEQKSKAMMAQIVQYLEELKLISKDDQLMFGGKKYAGLIRLPRHKSFRRIDIRLAPYHSYPYMLLGSSGDAMLMKLLRHTAKQKGWCLNEYGMGDKYAADDQNPNGFKPGTLKLVESEKEIFDLLGMPYLKPQERELKIWRAKYARAGVAAVEYLHKL
ncbi:hypothetical protein JCM10449v2_001283 [Rhodotorula kratochvilovae]